MAAILSVLMGAYNAEKTIAESIESVLSQAFRDFELIICDDGSIDNTFAIMQEFANKDARVKVFRNEYNEGIPFALNKCFDAASGKYYARQDADDLSHPLRFEKQICFLETNPEYSIVGSWADLFDVNGTWGIIRMKTDPSKMDFVWDIPHVNTSVVYRAEIIKAVGGYHASRQTRKRSEDYDLLCRIYTRNFKGYNIPEVLYHYRIGKDDYKRRKLSYRFYEMLIKYSSFRKLKLPLWTYIFIFKPIIVGLLPKRLIFLFHKIRFRRPSK